MKGWSSDKGGNHIPPKQSKKISGIHSSKTSKGITFHKFKKRKDSLHDYPYYPRYVTGHEIMDSAKELGLSIKDNKPVSMEAFGLTSKEYDDLVTGKIKKIKIPNGAPMYEMTPKEEAEHFKKLMANWN